MDGLLALAIAIRYTQTLEELILVNAQLCGTMLSHQRHHLAELTNRKQLHRLQQQQKQLEQQAQSQGRKTSSISPKTVQSTGVRTIDCTVRVHVLSVSFTDVLQVSLRSAQHLSV